MTDNKIKVLCISGPTASGKTALSVALAQDLNAEIISADSMQIYRGMDIATAKPSAEERQGIKHHLMDHINPDELYSVARFVEDATKAAKDISERGKLPIIAGGTGLYTDSLVNGIEFSEGETDLKLRSSLQERLKNEGIDKMLDLLESVDPESAQKMRTERNPKRIIRALEIFYTTGITMTEQNKRSKEKGSTFEAVKIALNFRDREVLYQRINRRVDIMVEMGLVNECREYLNSYDGETSKQAIGYKELKPYFDGKKTLEDCLETLKQSTRRYAKRQLTWFNRDPEIEWFYVDDYRDFNDLYNSVRSYLINKGFDFNERP